MLNDPGAVAGDYVSLGIVKSDDIKVQTAGLSDEAARGIRPAGGDSR